MLRKMDLAVSLGSVFAWSGVGRFEQRTRALAVQRAPMRRAHLQEQLCRARGQGFLRLAGRSHIYELVPRMLRLAKPNQRLGYLRRPARMDATVGQLVAQQLASVHICASASPSRMRVRLVQKQRNGNCPLRSARRSRAHLARRRQHATARRWYLAVEQLGWRAEGSRANDPSTKPAVQSAACDVKAILRCGHDDSSQPRRRCKVVLDGASERRSGHLRGDPPSTRCEQGQADGLVRRSSARRTPERTRRSTATASADDCRSKSIVMAWKIAFAYRRPPG